MSTIHFLIALLLCINLNSITAQPQPTAVSTPSPITSSTGDDISENIDDNNENDDNTSNTDTSDDEVSIADSGDDSGDDSTDNVFNIHSTTQDPGKQKKKNTFKIFNIHF